MPDHQLETIHGDTYCRLPTCGEYSGCLGKYTQTPVNDPGPRPRDNDAACHTNTAWRIRSVLPLGARECGGSRGILPTLAGINAHFHVVPVCQPTMPLGVFRVARLLMQFGQTSQRQATREEVSISATQPRDGCASRSGCGACNTGTVDSREKVRPGTGRKAGLGQAVGERTGTYHSVSLYCRPHTRRRRLQAVSGQGRKAVSAARTMHRDVQVSRKGRTPAATAAVGPTGKYSRCVLRP